MRRHFFLLSSCTGSPLRSLSYPVLAKHKVIHHQQQHNVVHPQHNMSTNCCCSSTATEVIIPLFFGFINQCSSANHIHQIHGFMITGGLDKDSILLCRFIDACSSLGFLDYAYSAFRYYYSHPDMYLYNTMIKALVSRPPLPTHDQCQILIYPKEAIFLYNEARITGLLPDSYSFPFALKAVVRLSSSSETAAAELGREIHCQAMVIGLDDNVYVAAALIQMYSTCGCIPYARKLFDGLPFRDVASWNAMISGYAKVGDADNARYLFDQMPLAEGRRNVISWTAMIAGYAQVNRPSEAISIFRRMQLEGVRPDEIAMLAALSACAQLGALHLGEWIHNYIEKNSLRLTVPLTNALIDMYAKSGNIHKALKVFNSMNNRSVVTWTTIIAGLALHGLGREALEIFSRMEMIQVSPNKVTLIAVLSACSHAGLVELGRFYFNGMYLRYGIKPNIEHYGCMIDLLGRKGCLQEAQQLLREMPFEANAAIWGSLLAASRIHNDVELGEKALKHLITMEPHNGGNYSLLSNIYASFGRWNEAGITRNVMRNTGVKKIAGGSCIEVNNRLHEFIVGDTSHPQSKMIYKVLHLINGQFKMAGDGLEEYWNLL